MEKIKQDILNSSLFCEIMKDKSDVNKKIQKLERQKRKAKNFKEIEMIDKKLEAQKFARLLKYEDREIALNHMAQIFLEQGKLIFLD